MRFVALGMVAAALAGVVSLAATELSGTVVDASGLAIPRAAIKVSGIRAVLSTETDDRGSFDLAALPEGLCRIHIEHAGFAPFDKDLTGEETSLRVQLTIETRHDSIVVKAATEGADPAPPGSISLDADELRKISNDPKVWVNYAQMLAGAANSPSEIYVDGLPASQLPPAALIARIVVNPDTFSAEYTDGSNAHIDIITKAPVRQFHFDIGSDALGAGGGSVLDPGPHAVSRSANGSISGAIPRSPLAFSLAASFTESEVPVTVTAVLPGAGFPNFDSDKSGTFTTRAISLAPDLYYYPSENFRLHLSHTETRASGRNFGVGGLTLMDAGIDNSFMNGETRLTFTGGGGRLSFRGGLVIERSGVKSHARNTEPGLNVLGDFSTGGPQILNSDVARLGWTWKSVFEPAGAPSWSAGISAGETSESRYDVANPGGVFTFPDLASYAQFLGGSTTAVWTGLRGDGGLHFRQVHVSPFFQRALWRSSHLTVNAGVRADTQSSVGVLVSPRLSAAAEWHGFVIRTGAGIFAHDIPGYVFVRAIEGDGNHLTPVQIDNVGPDAASQFAPDAGSLVRTSMAPSLTLPRQFIGKIAANRTFGHFTPGLEYTQTHDWKLLGSQRFVDADGWMDVIASNRARIARQLQSQLSYGWRGQRITFYHECVRTYDDTDGPFSFPQLQNDLTAEWARSAGRPSQNITFAGSFRPVKSLYLTLTDSWHGSAPYNITDAGDPEADGLFNDRGGRPRNSGNGPPFNSLSGYLSRRFAAPRAFGRMAHGVTVGLRGDNLLGNKNYLSVGSVAGSSSFGHPLAAAPGRSVRLWFSFD